LLECPATLTKQKESECNIMIAENENQSLQAATDGDDGFEAEIEFETALEIEIGFEEKDGVLCLVHTVSGVEPEEQEGFKNELMTELRKNHNQNDTKFSDDRLIIQFK
jgi:hypothetical protein